MRRMTARLGAVLVALASSLVSAADPWALPPPPRGQFALDRTSTLKGATLAELDRLASEIDDSGFGQLGVVVLKTTSGVQPRTFATNLFNHWGIGHGLRNDGVLIMLAMEDRKAELVVGSSNPLDQATTDRIMADDIVANMKKRDPDSAVLAAARAVQAALAARAQTVLPSQGPASPHVDDALGRYVRKETAFPDFTPRRWVIDLSESLSASERSRLEVLSAEVYGAGKGRLVFLVFATGASWPTLRQLAQTLDRQLLGSTPLGLVVYNATTKEASIRLPAALTVGAWEGNQVAAAESVMRSAPDATTALEGAGSFAANALLHGVPPRPMNDVLREAFERFSLFIWSGFGGAGVLGLVFFRRWNRSRSRSCERCSQPRERLGEAADDRHLSSGQQTEESLGSVDYDVWWCGRCNDPLVLRYAAFFSRYGSCPSCRFKTATSTSTTLRHATEYSEGSVEVTTTCTNCNHRSTSTHTTARLSSSSDSSSSSSSSSSSWGGGSSSGGGSSGSW